MDTSFLMPQTLFFFFFFFNSGPQELFISICIFLPIIGIGLYPDFVFSLSVDNVQTLYLVFFFFFNTKWLLFRIKNNLIT